MLACLFCVYKNALVLIFIKLFDFNGKEVQLNVDRILRIFVGCQRYVPFKKCENHNF